MEALMIFLDQCDINDPKIEDTFLGYGGVGIRKVMMP